MFKVKVTGAYVARSGTMDKERIKKSYEIEGIIPTVRAALSVVKNKLLVPALSKKYPDYITYLTYHIVEITPLDAKSAEELGKAEIAFMDRPALIKYCKENAIGVFNAEKDEEKEYDNPRGLDARYFPDLFKLREAVEHAKEDAKGFSRWFYLHKEDLELDLQMAAANPELFHVKQSDVPFVASVSNVQKPKSLPRDAHAKNTGDRLGGLTADMKRDGEMGPIDPGVSDTDVDSL